MVWSPFRRTPSGLTTLRRTAQNFALFSPSPTMFSFFFLSLGVFSLNFGGFWKRRVWALGLWCETPAASGPPGLHTITLELQTYTFDGPGASNTTKKPREDTMRGRKSEIGGGETEKKREILGPPPFGAPLFGASPFAGPIFLGLGPTLWGRDTHQIQKWIGPNWSNQDGPNGIGQSLSPFTHCPLVSHCQQSPRILCTRCFVP